MDSIKHIETGKIYRVLHSDCRIKVNGKWISGFVYYDPLDPLPLYVREGKELMKFEILDDPNVVVQGDGSVFNTGIVTGDIKTNV